MAPQPASPTAREEALSVSKMLHLMQLELDQAQKFDYAISFLVVGIDGFNVPGELYLRKLLMQLLFKRLKNVTFNNQVRGLGLTTDHFLLAVFPHLKPDRVEKLAEELMAEGEQITHPRIPEDRAISLSAGISHNLTQDEVTFEGLLVDAETGLSVAQSGGGGRCVLWKEVKNEIDQIRIDLEKQIAQIEAQQGEDNEHEAWGRDVVAGALSLFREQEDPSKAMVRMQQNVMDFLKKEIDRWREFPTVQSATESNEKIDMLERRIRKLMQELDRSESELKRVAAMKSLDNGIASIYRTVQGLGDDDDAESKKEMLKNIFDANLALRQEAEELAQES